MALRFIPDHKLDHSALDAKYKRRLDHEDTLRHVVHVVTSTCETLDQKHLKSAEVKSIYTT